ILPMLAKRTSALPEGEGWIFEPKWDGFRALVFRDNDELFIQSRDEKSLNRYFPELVQPLKAQLPPKAVLDGEIVVFTPDGLDFGLWQMRIPPPAPGVARPAEKPPASIVFFDLLGDGDSDLRSAPSRARRARLESIPAHAAPPLHVTPAT